MKILIAIDGSPCSLAAMNEVAARTWPAESEVRLITVESPTDPGLLQQNPTSAFDEMVLQQKIAANRMLHEAAEQFSRVSPSLKVTTVLREGWPKETIVAEAENWGANLIVVGSQGLGPIRRFFLGSVSLHVAQNAPCSVEIVRSPDA